MAWAAVSGALVGLGAFLLISPLTSTPPDLRAALARLDGDAAMTSGTAAGGRVGAWLVAFLARPGRLPIPHRDLDLLGQSVERFMLERLACLLLGLALPSLLSVVLTVAGIAVGWPLPVGVGLLLGAVLSLAPDWAVREDAARRRREFRQALTSFLDLVVLARAAGAGPGEALELSAHVARGWVFQRIAAVLDAARQAGVPPWAGLARLGEQAGVPELTDLADITELAGAEGAKVLNTLTARADAMRAAALADTKAAANRATTAMVMPLAVLGAGYLLLLGFPVMAAIVQP
ncbi:type II secretion system F family protein (plasmid) [Nonomuraea sp. NBC_00507]|uniref:type II secretion system F family protein n=1 Tax=Nonomuraea sp. NBC_00507 TaxID=2976002 RepID=UPI002E17034A